MKTKHNFELSDQDDWSYDFKCPKCKAKLFVMYEDEDIELTKKSEDFQMNCPACTHELKIYYSVHVNFEVKND